MRGKVQAVLLIILLSPPVIAGHRWHVVLPGGNMRFQGEIIAESCRVAVGDRQMRVSMGQIADSRVNQVGADANPVPFVIHLQDCNTAVSDRVGVAFRGVADNANPDVLALTDEPQAARGIGVALFDERDRLIPLNREPHSWTKLHPGAVELRFVAKYRATQREISGGVANAQAWFALTYQ
ncbi:fimbrial protein [Dickeya lacustris]|uniref:Fimbrial protein n=1 Tax=Dickeya lacustris TaxID=2259638 RepID=A0ABY8GAN5_9GAMM|nr:fimbrial protein [Dickeya lacustris]WFN57021.1 fimbrial protein [Dickeya lacustris]